MLLAKLGNILNQSIFLGSDDVIEIYVISCVMTFQNFVSIRVLERLETKIVNITEKCCAMSK